MKKTSPTRYIRCLLLTLTSFLLLGCSQKFQGTNATLKEALKGAQDISLTNEDIQAIPYASMYARINSGPQIFLVLAFAEKNPTTGNTQLKWISQDYVLVVTENGRIVKTLNLLDANLDSISSLPDFTDELGQLSWGGTYDWQPGYRFNQTFTAARTIHNSQKLHSVLWSKDLLYVTEEITFTESGESFTNKYWVDDFGNVAKSSQWLVPETLHIEFEILKPFKADSEE